MKAQIFSVLLLIGATVLFSCNDSSTVTEESIETAENQLPVVDEEENADMLKPSTFLTLKLLRSTFSLAEADQIERMDSDGKCSYDWSKDNKNYHVDFQFYFPGEMDDDRCTKMYEQLTNGYTQEKDKPVALEGVGTKAIFSKLGGGQLIVRHENEILILNMSVIDLEGFKNLGETDDAVQKDLMEKGSNMAKSIIQLLDRP
ncbi:MAG: hypothetical protein ACK40M_00660 [Flavobacteriales bacterium]